MCSICQAAQSQENLRTRARNQTSCWLPFDPAPRQAWRRCKISRPDSKPPGVLRDFVNRTADGRREGLISAMPCASSAAISACSAAVTADGEGCIWRDQAAAPRLGPPSTGRHAIPPANRDVPDRESPRHGAIDGPHGRRVAGFTVARHTSSSSQHRTTNGRIPGPARDALRESDGRVRAQAGQHLEVDAKDPWLSPVDRSQASTMRPAQSTSSSSRRLRTTSSWSGWIHALPPMPRDRAIAASLWSPWSSENLR